MDDFEYIDRTEPDSPTPRTPAPSIPPSEDPEDANPRTRLERLGRAVYNDVWNEFYDWEHGYSTEILGTLAHTHFLASKPEVERVAKNSLACLIAGDDARWQARVESAKKAVDGTDTVVVSVTHVAAAPSGHQHRAQLGTTDVPIPVVTVPALPPHPAYESCPPVSRSVIMGTVHEHTLSFLPYADNDRFPANAYQTKFKTLEWEIPLDPDLEMIQIEAIRRLHAVHNVETVEIDRTKIFKPTRKDHNLGLQWELSQRDVLHWPGSSKFQAARDSQLPHYTPDVNDLRQRLASNLKTFCPSIICLHSPCQTHGQIHTSPDIPSTRPKLTGRDLILSEGVPCGLDCFRYIQDFEKFMETFAPSGTSHRGSLDTLETVLGIAPDLFPCQLAIICLRSCKEVFVQRYQLFPDHTILPTIGDSLTDSDVGRSNHAQQKKKGLKFVDSKSSTRCVLQPACSHAGPCNHKGCNCYVKKQHCSTMCRCGVKCERQWPGCSCTNGKCSPGTCDCERHGRECIPGICIRCDAGGQTSRPCKNTRMQRSADKPVEIKCGSYGLGAFACQAMKKGAFLGSYTGHILSDTLAAQAQDISKHTLRNYLFEVTPDPDVDVHLGVLDAAYLGNGTRFLNHPQNTEGNVFAKPMLVVGEHQVGFFTSRRIKAGEELLLHYGDTYWPAKSGNNVIVD